MNNASPRTEHADNSVATMTSVLVRLHDGFLAEHLDDDLDAILGAPAGPAGVAGSRHQASRRRSLRQLVSRARRRDEAPSEEELQTVERFEHLHRILGQLANIARQRAGRMPGPELGEAIMRADRLRARPVPEDAVDRVHLRRLALAAAEMMDLLALEERHVRLRTTCQ